MWKILPLLLLAGCGWETRHHYYATNFDADDGKHMLAWPAGDPDGRFRYVVDGGGGLHDDRPVHTWPGELGSFASVTVVLPKKADGRLRSRAEELLRAARKKSRNAGTHVVFDDDRWQRFRKSKEVTDRLHELKSRAKLRRPNQGGPFYGLFEGLLLAMVVSMAPDALVVPSDNGFLMASKFFAESGDVRKIGDIEIREVAQAEILAFAMREPDESEAVKAWGMKLARRSVVVVRPHGTPDARCLVLVEALGRIDGVRTVYLSAKETYAELKMPDKLRAYLAAH